MDIVAGKKGTFFLVKNNLAADIVQHLSKMSFADFGLYVAWFTLRKISASTCEQYAEKKHLNVDILKDFSRFNDAVYYKETETLMSFFENDDNFRHFRKINCLKENHRMNFSNDFMYKIPRFNFAYIHDNFYLQNQEIPAFIKKAGISIKRISRTYLVQYNHLTHKVHLLPKFSPEAKSINNENILYFYENSFMFFPGDRNVIRKIDIYFKRLKSELKKSWFPYKKDDKSLLADAIKKICPQPLHQEKYSALYNKYIELRQFRTDYKSRFVYECHKLRNRLLIEGRLRKFDSKKLLPEDVFVLMVENERSSNLALTFERINEYWFDKDYEKLCQKEPCLKCLDGKTVSEREKMLSDMEFVTKLKLQHWMNGVYEGCKDKIFNQTLSLIDISPITKPFCGTKTELRLMLSMLYSFRIYNPTLRKYQMKRVDQYIEDQIEMSEQIKTDLRKKYNDLAVRQTKALSFLKIRYGFTDALIQKATKIYNATLKF